MVKLTSPGSTRVVDKDGQTISVLLQIFNQFEAPSLVLEIRDNVLALAWAELVKTLRCLTDSVHLQSLICMI